MSSHSDNDVPTCCRCSTIPSGKCFIMDCGHILCDRCSHEDVQFSPVIYRCSRHGRSVRITSLAFCNQITKTIIRMADAVMFAIEGQYNCQNCQKNAVVEVKICDHTLCINCLDIIIDDGNIRQLQYITCPVKNCHQQFPLIFAVGIRGGCQINPHSQRYMHEELTMNVYLRCEVPLKNGQLCNFQGCFYVNGCGYIVCYGCMVQHIKDSHTPAYVKTSLADVVYCLKPDCTKIIIVNTVKQILSKVVQEERKNEMQLNSFHPRTSFCWSSYCRKNATVFLACGHAFCGTCFLFAKVKYIPGELDGGYMRCRVCTLCTKWIRESSLGSITLDEDDFLSTTACKCNTIEHGSAVVSTRCCNLNLCLGCLNDVQNKPVVSNHILGKKYDDVIKCMEGCQLGVPRRLLLQFIKKHNYQDVMGNHSQTDFAKTHKIVKEEAHQLKEIRSNERGKDMTTQSLDVGSKHGKESGIFDSSLLKQSNSSHASSEHNRLIREDTSYKSTAGDDGSEEQMETNDNGSGSPLNIATASANIAKDSCSSSSAIVSVFEGIRNLKPVTDESHCIDCGREAFVKLACNHPYCWVCLFDLNVICHEKICCERFPRKDITDLSDKLQQNAIKESEADSNMDTTGTSQTSKHRLAAETIDHGSGGIIKNVIQGSEADSNMNTTGTAQTSTHRLAAETIDHGSGGNIKGVRNLGLTCYANSIFQVLGQTSNFKERLKNSVIEALNKDQSLPLTDNLAAILEQLNGKGGCANVETEVDNFLKKVVSLEGRYLMNDCCEFLMCVFEGLKAEDETATLLFENTIQTFFTFKPCEHTELGNPQISHSLLIPLSKGGNTSNSVSAGLKELVKTETFGKGVLPCRSCNNTTETKQGLVLSKLPEILIIQIGRVKAQKKSFWKYAKYAQKNEEFVKYDEDFDVPQTSEVNGNVEEIIFNYRLFGVVIHSGSIDSGHYYAYVKKLHTDRWYSCNDSSVRPIEKKHVFGNPNAYLLFYEKKHVVRRHVIIHNQPSKTCCQM